MTPNETTFLAERTLVDGVLQPEIAVTVAGGKITRVGPASELAPDADVRRFPRRLLMPGTLNAHNHSFQSMLRGIADDCDFFTWRDRALYGYSPHMDEETVYHGARFAFAEMIRNGVTTVCDFFYIHATATRTTTPSSAPPATSACASCWRARCTTGTARRPSIRRRSTRRSRARASCGRQYRGRDDVHVLSRATLAARRQPGDDPGRIEARRGAGHTLPHARGRGTLRARHDPRELRQDADSLAGVAGPRAGAA